MAVGFNAVNTSIKIKSMQFILALHDASGKLVDARMEEILIAPNDGKTVSINMPIPQITDGLNLRVMVWDSSSTTPHICVTMTAE